MKLAPVPRRSVVDEAFEALRARILHGHWAPGDRLPTEAELTRALGVGRSTVREALNRLGSAGLVDARHGSTRRVLDFRDHAGLEVLSDLVVSPDGVVDLRVVRATTEMRAAIAPDVARLAAVRRSDEQAARLIELAETLDGDLEARLLHTLDWWTELVLASDNLAYRLAYNTLRTTYREGRPTLRPILADELRADALYRQIATAVRDRRADDARTACAALVALGTTAILAAIGD